jgi:NADH-quinone oxidoreductase subunit M
VLISRFGDPHDAQARRDAGQRFILYTAVGSTLMLVGILLLVASAGTSDLGQLAVSGGRAIPASRQTLIAVLLVIGLGVKVPVFPLHTWLPPAHTTAPTAGSVVLASVLLKMGTYGLVRLPLATVPEGFSKVAPFLGIAGVIGIVWGGLICLVERDLKRLIAYSSVAHMGFVALGLASGTRTGLQAALFANVAHGVIAALLFFVVGGLKARWGSVKLDIPRPAVRETAPHLGFALILGLAAGLGLPGLAGFWGEFMAMYAAWTSPSGHQGLFRALAVAAALGAAVAAAYQLRVARSVWVGDEVTDSSGSAEETRGAERAVFTVLAVAVVTLGVLPGLLLSVTDGTVTFLLGGGR